MADYCLLAPIVASAGSSNPKLSIFQFSTYTDQVGINDNPANAIGPNSSVVKGYSTVWLPVPSYMNAGMSIYTHILQTDRFHDGTDIRGGKSPLLCTIDVDNNDPSYNPFSPTTYGVGVWIRDGINGPTYGTCKGIVSSIHVFNAGSSNNEPCAFFGNIIVGSAANPQNSRVWLFDLGIHGPVGIQPNILSGFNLITSNYYNGSPSGNGGSLAAGCSLVNLGAIGNGSSGFVGATAYPWDVGYHANGKVDGGTGDGYNYAFLVGKQAGGWGNSPNYGGDQGQHGHGFTVAAKNNGTSVTRLGAFVSEGSGEGGGLIFGLGSTDSSRTSLWRSSTSNLSIKGNIIPTSIISANDDAGASIAGIPLGAIYHTSGILKVRLI